MEIHVTGANGLLGTCVVRSLSDLGRIRSSDVDTMDVTDVANVQRVLSEHPPDILVHTAALKGNKLSRDNPVAMYNVNSTGTLNLLEASRKLGVKRFVFISSLSVHGPGTAPCEEENPIRPIHPYGASKACGEALVYAYAQSYGIRGTILRPNFIVGQIPPPRPYADNLLYDFLVDLDQKGCVELAGDGSFEREWVHPADVALAVRLAILADMPGCEAFILSANRVSMLGLAQRLAIRFARGEVRTNPKVSGFTMISSSEKAKRLLGWSPQRDLDFIIHEIWDEYRRRQNHPDHRH